MKCISPIRLKNDQGLPYYVPCGKCAWCLKSKRDQWVFRLMVEKHNSVYARFLTLTYDDDHLKYNVDEDTGEMIPTVCKCDIVSFNRLMWKDGLKFRFMIASEYGPKTGRPHYHGIYFSDDRINYLDYWRYGSNNADLPARDSSCKYIVKYMLKGSNVPPGASPNFHKESRRPGLGSQFVYKGEPYILEPGGVKVVPGHYYRRKYLSSLDGKLRDLCKESTMDYLVSCDEFSSLRKDFERQAGDGSDFDSWKYDLYLKDLRQQYKINKKK